MHAATTAPPLCQPARQSIRHPLKKAPANACDCHIHIIGPHARFPLSPSRAYTPPEASIAQYEAVQDILGTGRVVIVQASVYGTDNRCTLAALEHFGQKRARGVAVVDPSISDAELKRMHDAGVRGVRVNLVTPGGPPVAHLSALAKRIAPLGWHTQVFLNGAALPEIAPTLQALPTEVVIDHLGHVPCTWGVKHPAYDALRSLLDSGRVWLKVCAYRSSAAGYPFEDVDDIAANLIAYAPQRCVWGTDWPHPSFEGTIPDDGELLDAFMRWAPDPAVQQKVLVDNPAKLYQFS
ncbi:amidohydrolase family protein [Paraburkholderia unamae]|uniref:TIM-barrel fold metal-dependent hydrolase n=1 Tax=Paraburkholderia unamae TaxID=219649 RepID=A0ABX5KLX6_9BURK|nr:amidohydrolase family protein [Paraburkholderia unamae]PVX81648.1 putative TIM-barrel fold metal-dependent hydrolase [Paraburkholderia unamae]